MMQNDDEGLTILALSLFAFQGIFDLLRVRLLIQMGRWIGDQLSLRVYHMIGRLTLTTRAADSLQPLRDINQIRNFLSGPGPLALLDLPWIPFYLAACFLLHFWIGITAMIGAVLLVSLTLLTEAFTRDLTRKATHFGARRSTLAEASRRNAEVLQAMGIAPRFGEIWNDASRKFLENHQRGQRCHGRARRHIQGDSTCLAIMCLGGRRLFGGSSSKPWPASSSQALSSLVVPSPRSTSPSRTGVASLHSAELGPHERNAQGHPHRAAANGAAQAGN